MLFSHKIDTELELVFLQKSMAAELYKLISNDVEHLQQWLPWVHQVKAIADTEKFIKDSGEGFIAQKLMNVAICYNGQIVGVSGYNSIHLDLKKVTIGYWLGSAFQGKGIMTRVVNSLIQNAFENMAIQKVEIAAAVGNKPSRAVIERVGGIQEGIIKNAENLHGKIVDHVIYGIYN